MRKAKVCSRKFGNLGITFEEKTLAQEEGNYIEFLQERQKSAACRDKKVVIDYSLNSERVAFRITDEGNGFDHRRMMTKTPAEINALNLGHGRGIFMAKSIFDRIQYNSKGNQVVLLKYFKEPEFSRNL
ncbi:MAG: ATP-binding protein [Leptospira sp.]|nr:ATP-binding protein [Leptospira sp.]